MENLVVSKSNNLTVERIESMSLGEIEKYGSDVQSEISDEISKINVSVLRRLVSLYLICLWKQIRFQRKLVLYRSSQLFSRHLSGWLVMTQLSIVFLLLKKE